MSENATIQASRFPPQIKYIIGNEAAERFCYYGINGILVIFMTKYLRNANDQLAIMTEAEANAWYHTFVTCVYFLPILGAVIADALLGKYRTILILSIVYCLGNLALFGDTTRLGLTAGLLLIALGSGGIKPCVSANVGDQFNATNQHLLPKVFSWFYFSINIGSAFSTLLIPEVLERKGANWAFGLPGIFMFLATVVFWLGRKQYVNIPPVGVQRYAKEMLNRENLKAIANLFILVPFAAMFWALWQQNFSSWVNQAKRMDRHLFGYEWLPAQIQTVNPAFVLIMLPLFAYVIYPAIDKVFRLTPLRRFGLGLWSVIVAFVIVGLIQKRIDAGQTPHILWQILAFVVLTAGEVMVSVTHIEFSYTQAPKKMKSLVMCLYLGSIALGNAFAATVNFLIERGHLNLTGANYFFFFAAIMLVVACLFLLVAPSYRGKTYIQD